MTTVMPPPPPPPAASAVPKGPTSAPHKAARIGLVLALVLVLAGLVGLVAKAGDDARTPFAITGEAIDDPVGDTVAVTPIVVPEGFKVVQGDGVHMAVPAGWLDLSSEVDEVLDEQAMAELFPDLAPDARDAARSVLNDGALFQAMDVSPEGAGHNINILSTPEEVPLGIIEKQIGRELERAGVGAVVHGSSEIDTPMGRGLRLAYSIEVAGEPVESVQFYVPVDGRTLIVTASGATDVGDQAIQTLRLGDAPA